MPLKKPQLPVPSISETDRNTGRQRQSKRDEAIRQKFERELSKKRTSPVQKQQQYRKIAGTVSALRPAQALTVKETMLVIEASQLMAAKRSDSVLVVDDDDHLSGIFTAKDIAYRVVAVDGMDAKSTTVADIMTPNPMCVTASTSAQDALNLMVSRGFRHLPVCNEEGDIFGLLDITKCLYDALGKMERAYGSSRKLYDALEGVEREWAGNPVQLVQYMEVLRDRMSCPDMTTVMERGAVEVNYKVNVQEIAKLMKNAHTTAVLVMKRHRLTGIFTTKDIVLRVIAAGLNPENCSVVRVMTPEPDCAEPTTTVLEALKRMNDGHYLNLPILEKGHVVGMVDVLKLTYATLEQMNSIQGNDGEGPMWSRFWDSFGVESESHTSSDHNGSRHPPSNQIITPEPSTSLSQLQNLTEIEPDESASVVNSSLASSLTKQDSNAFTFKFTSPGGKTHRFSSKSNDFGLLLETVRQKVIGEHSEFVSGNTTSSNDDDATEWLSLYYKDEDDDLIRITSDADVEYAVSVTQDMAQTRVKLYVDDSCAPPVKTDSAYSPATTVVTNQQQQDLTSLTDSEESVDPPVRRKKVQRGAHQDVLLPAAVVFLGVAVISVFTYSHLSRSK